MKQVALTVLGIGSALCVALIAPSAAEKIISVVGATGVCMVSYIIPVAIQIKGHRRRWRHPDDEVAHAAAARYFAWHRGGSSAGAAGRSGDMSSLTAPLLGAPFASLGEVAAEPEGCVPHGVAAAAGGAAPGGYAKQGDEEAGWMYGGSTWAGCCETWDGLVQPTIVLVIGVGFSVAALYVAVATLMDEQHG